MTTRSTISSRRSRTRTRARWRRRQQLVLVARSKASDAIAAATRVDLYGMAASGVVAIDAQQKLHRIGVLAFAWNDPHIALTSAALLGSGDGAIGTPTRERPRRPSSRWPRREPGRHNHRHHELPQSRLGGTRTSSDHRGRETSLRSGATASRIAALTVVDCLYIAVAHRDLERATRGRRDPGGRRRPPRLGAVGHVDLSVVGVIDHGYGGN